MSSSIFHINRQTEDALGTGLPFMLNVRNQQRYDEIQTSENSGQWFTPQNRLPCLQVWCEFPLTKIELVKVVNGIDQTPFEIPLANFEQRCAQSGIFTTNIYYTTETNLGFTLDCGDYYFKLEFSTGTKPYYYSEIFTVGGVCAFGVGLSWVVISVDMSGNATTAFTINHASNMNPTAYSSTVGATPFTTQTFTAVLPLGNTSVAIGVTTAYCGNYEQPYQFSNLAGVVTSSKQY